MSEGKFPWAYLIVGLAGVLILPQIAAYFIRASENGPAALPTTFSTNSSTPGISPTGGVLQ